MDAYPPEARPLVVHLGVVRAGTTARRRFNVTNLNPVEVNVTSVERGGALPFASLRLVGEGPLARAPQALAEIGRHIQVLLRCRACFCASVCIRVSTSCGRSVARVFAVVSTPRVFFFALFLLFHLKTKTKQKIVEWRPKWDKLQGHAIYSHLY